jgi:hypothetical protein
MSKYFNEVGIQSIQDLVTRINQAFAKVELERVGGISYGGGGVTKLSQLEIDDDKNWADRSINHLHSILIQPDMLPGGELDTILIQHLDKVFKTLFNVFRDDMGISHTQNFLNFILGDYNLLLGIEHEYRRHPLPLDRYYAIMGADNLDTMFNFKSLSVNAYDGFAVYGNYIYLDTPDLEFVLSSNAELTFYGENQNAIITGRSENLFRIQDMEDPEKHVVDSIYHDDTYNLDIVGTRWAMKVNDNDYHMGIGITHDLTSGNVWSGIVSTYNFSMTTTKTSPFEITGIGFGMSDYDGYVRMAEIVLDDYIAEDWQPYFGIRCKGDIPFLTQGYPDSISYIAISPKTMEDGVSLFVHQGSTGFMKYMEFYVKPYEGSFTIQWGTDWSKGLLGKITSDYGYYAIVPNDINNLGYFYVDFSNAGLALSANGLRYIVAKTDSRLFIRGAGGGDRLHIYNFGSVDFSTIQATNFRLQNWTTSTRPSNPVEGQIGYNTDTHQFEGWNGSSWVILG